MREEKREWTKWKETKIHRVKKEENDRDSIVHGLLEH